MRSDSPKITSCAARTPDTEYQIEGKLEKIKLPSTLADGLENFHNTNPERYPLEI